MARPSASASASNAAMRSASTDSTRCLTPGCASSAKRRRKMESAAERRLFWGTAAAIVASDVITKLLAESWLARRLPFAVIGDWVQLRLVYNQGAPLCPDVGANFPLVLF